MEHITQVTYEIITDLDRLQEVFDSLPDTFAWDFEVATKYTTEERAAMEAELAEIEERLKCDNY